MFIVPSFYSSEQLLLAGVFADKVALWGSNPYKFTPFQVHARLVMKAQISTNN